MQPLLCLETNTSLSLLALKNDCYPEVTADLEHFGGDPKLSGFKGGEQIFMASG